MAGRNKGNAPACLCLILLFLLSACGASQDVSDTSLDRNWQDSGRQFICEFREPPETLTVNNIRPLLSGDIIHYISQEEDRNDSWKLCRWNVAEDSVQETNLDFCDSFNCIAFYIDGEGNQYFFIVDMTEKSGDVFTRLLIKLDGQGKEEYRRNITGDLETSKPIILGEMLVDGEHRVYLSGGGAVWMFDEHGRFHGTYEPEAMRMGIGCGRDGKVYMGELGAPGKGVKWQELDFVSCEPVKDYRNFPGTVTNSVIPQGDTCDFLPFDSVGISGYDMRSENLVNIVKWENCDMLGSYVQNLSVMEDGSFLVLFNEHLSWEIAILTETNLQASKKKELVLGTLYTNPAIQEAVVNFNRSREDCRIVIREYEGSSGEKAGEDAVAAVNNDFAAGRGPDLMVLNQGLPVEDYAAKGVTEDLTPYLENSVRLRKEGFVESVLNMYTFDGILTGIPSSFGLQTLVGKESVVGGKMGCRAETLMELAERYPEAALMQEGTNLQVLGACILCCQDAFVDGEAGECYFDAPGFIQILEFASGFPDIVQGLNDGESLAGLLQNEEILLMPADIYGIYQFKRGLEMFGKEKVTCIGYPTSDGSTGCIVYPCNEVYGIAAGSDYRQEAWSFIEAYLAGDLKSGESTVGLPADREKLKSVIKKAMEGEYRGYPETAPLTEAESEQLMELVDSAEPGGISDDVISSIILEEAQPCFQGRRTAQEAAALIQNRVWNYLQEKK